MAPDADQVRTTLWWLVTTFVLVVRLLATIATVLLTIFWVIAAVRDSFGNVFLWPAVGSAVALLVSTYLYSHLRARYPRRNGWIP
ncbi:hypothetical protein GYA93_09290 [Gordonia desulfuricans]|uniref:Uncharacterized protein n=1 Tax=Gordonia desulfuricans TaxID=89051 RepID=A0A7K3LNE4_9ACTN|nr:MULTISPECIES: hypothetical protein [Gordonia]EMP12224.1 hypothetical protein ISGA_1335 [Gordonia sp. NB41Y]NDK89770.1 hypothetical protein [Gordonia desulfuricans]WLP92817.1 hypothetical protein Q9K23_11620 [Gordonia sp. NB41Y]